MKFSITMPVLEEYVRRKYTSPDESSYLRAEKQFFDWVYQNETPEFQDFSRKHLKIVRSKAPSLTTLLARSIVDVNSKGFRIPLTMAEALQKRRGKMFHAAPIMDKEEAKRSHLEVLAATALLMLHTYLDFGIDVSCLASRYEALWEFQPFLIAPKDEVPETESERKLKDPD
jgi:hypothetical protein